MSYDDRYTNEKTAGDLSWLPSFAQSVGNVVKPLIENMVDPLRGVQATDALTQHIYDAAKAHFEKTNPLAISSEQWLPQNALQNIHDTIANHLTDQYGLRNGVELGTGTGADALLGRAIYKHLKKKSSLEERYASEKTANKYIKERDGKWVIIQKGTGKELSEHDTKELAEASFAAMMAHKHGNIALDPTDWRNQFFNLDADW
jgi:hypothetical protein